MGRCVICGCSNCAISIFCVRVKVTLSTSYGTLLFPTPVGKSYTCDQEQVITMFAQVSAMQEYIRWVDLGGFIRIELHLVKV